MIKVSIVEDCPQEAEWLKQQLKRYETDSNLKFEVHCYKDAEGFLVDIEQGQKYQLLFMDIELPGINGMEACIKIRKSDENICIVFITNMQKYAIDGYKVDAVGYILKPIIYDEFVMIMKKAKKRLLSRNEGILKIKMGKEFRYIREKDITYIEVFGHNVVFHTEKGSYTQYDTLSSVRNNLTLPFALCSKSYLINLSKVQGVNGNQVIIGNEMIKISRFYKNTFLQELMNHFGGL